MGGFFEDFPNNSRKNSKNPSKNKENFAEKPKGRKTERPKDLKNAE